MESLQPPADENEPRLDAREPLAYEDYMTLGEVAKTFNLLGNATTEDIERAGPLRQPSPLLGRLTMVHGIETVMVPLGEGKVARAISPRDANYLFDILNPRKS